MPRPARRWRERSAGWEGIDARLARELLTDIGALTVRINALEKEIEALAAVRAAALLQLPGCGPLTAAKLFGETAGIARFGGEAKYAMHAGVAPIPVWSGRTAGRVRLNKSGNRQLNAALHRIAVTQIRLAGVGAIYYRKTSRRRGLHHRGPSLLETTTRPHRVQHPQEQPGTSHRRHPQQP